MTGFGLFFRDFGLQFAVVEGVPEGTVEVLVLALLALVALPRFVHEDVVVTFLPAVTESAVLQEGTTALLVTLHTPVFVPVGTLHHPVVVLFAFVLLATHHQVLPDHFPSVVLRVVRVHTVLSVVFRNHWAPHCFVEVEKKVLVLRHFVQQLDSELRLVVHERTETLVGTLFQHVRVERTVLGFEPVVVVSKNKKVPK